MSDHMRTSGCDQHKKKIEVIMKVDRRW